MLSFQKLDVSSARSSLSPSPPISLRRFREATARWAITAFSVPLNIAEAAGRASDADAARHYAIARGSAMESAAVLDVVRCLGALEEGKHRRGLELLSRIVAMLTKLCR